jgi:hypothetical protein
MDAAATATETAYALEAFKAFGPVLAIKLYRIALEHPPAVPTLPCLDHEAMLHEGIAPHAAAYVQDSTSGHLHELVVIPAQRRIEIDAVSTWGEQSADSRIRLMAHLAQRFPGHKVRVLRPLRWRGDKRVANACRAQVSLRDVLIGVDIPAIKASIDRLFTVGMLMEKESRVASWGVRTVTGPLLAAAGFVLFGALGYFVADLGEGGVEALRYGIVAVLGAVFLYYGLKAVQLTGMSNRVWKRASEYNLILTERRRLSEAARPERRAT